MMNTLGIELKSCPFCGGKVNIQYIHADYDHVRDYPPCLQIKCCHAKIREKITHRINQGSLTCEEATANFITKEWNKRA
jgi:hypothetical protein